MLPVTIHTRVSYDTRIKTLRSWFDTSGKAISNKDQLAPRDFVFKTLQESAGQFA